MDTQTIEQTKQIIESIKTLNLNLNDATTQKLADIILPIIHQIMVYKYIEMFMSGLGWIISLGTVLIIVKMIISYTKWETEKNNERYNR